MTTLIERDDLHRQRVGEQAYLHTAQAGATLPLIQSTITGFLLGLAAFFVALKLRAEDAWFYGLITWLVVQVITWLILQWHWFSLTKLEKLTGFDLNGDGVLGDQSRDIPQAVAKTVQVNVRETTNDGHLRVTVARFPIDEARLAQLAQGLLAGTPFAERFWTGSGKLLALSEFREMRTEMLKRGMLEQVNPKTPARGYRLSRAGRAAMRELASMMDDRYAPSPTPPESIS
jgi:hypothetical protein